MRLRRETGDFSIKLTFNEETHEPNDVQLPKGLSAEDLVGVFTYMELDGLTYVAPVTFAMDAGLYVIVLIPSLRTDRPMMFYDTSTGVLSTRQIITATKCEAFSKEPMFRGIVTHILVDDVVRLNVNVEGSSVPVGTYEGTVTRLSTMPQDYTASWDDKSALIPKGYRSIGISYSVNGVSKTVDLYGSPNGELIGHPAYVGMLSSIISI